MTKQRTSTDDQQEARRCLAVYGVDLARWPAPARTRWGALAMSEALREDREEAALLDAMLDGAAPLKTPHDLKNTIAAAYRPPAEKRPFLALEVGVLSGWLRPASAGAFASLAALGFAFAALTGGATSLPPEYEAYAYVEYSGFAGLEDEAGFLWDAE